MNLLKNWLKKYQNKKYQIIKRLEIISGTYLNLVILGLDAILIGTLEQVHILK